MTFELIFLNIPRCFSLLLQFLLSDLTVSFLALVEHKKMGKIFREGSFQLNLCYASLPGGGNDRLMDSQKLVDLKKDVGSTESCFQGKGGCTLLNARTPQN